jgi:hypothetical protein
MENKGKVIRQSKSLLVAAAFGAVLAIGVLVLFCSVLKNEFIDMPKLVAEFKELGRKTSVIQETMQLERAKDLKYLIIFGLMGVCGIAAAVLNILGIRKDSDKHILIAGILYIPAVNIVSLVLCFLRYANVVIKRKLLFAAGIVGIAMTALILMMALVSPVGSDKTAFICFMAASLLAVILNIIRWRGKLPNVFTLIAGIVYVLSIFGIISAVLCFVDYAIAKKSTK